MKEFQTTVFEAFDGQRFDTAWECKKHEEDRAYHRLAGLTIEQINAAETRADPSLADAFEAFGKRCLAARMAAGDLRRKPKGTGIGQRLVDGVREAMGSSIDREAE